MYWHGKGKVPNLLYLPVSKEWIGDPKYEKLVLKPLQKWLKDLPDKYGFKTQFEIHPLENIDDYKKGFQYLLAKMKELRNADHKSTIYIDSTSAPKTWLLAAMRVIPFFPRVVIYHVKSGMTPKDYSEEQISDKGGETKTIEVGSECDEILEELVLGDGKHSLLFKELFTKSGPSREAIKTEEFIDPLVEKMPDRYGGRGRENTHKAVTVSFRELADAGQLVEVVGPGGKKRVRLTEGGFLVGEALYPAQGPPKA